MTAWKEMITTLILALLKYLPRHLRAIRTAEDTTLFIPLESVLAHRDPFIRKTKHVLKSWFLCSIKTTFQYLFGFHAASSVIILHIYHHRRL